MLFILCVTSRFAHYIGAVSVQPAMVDCVRWDERYLDVVASLYVKASRGEGLTDPLLFCGWLRQQRFPYYGPSVPVERIRGRVEGMRRAR